MIMVLAGINPAATHSVLVNDFRPTLSLTPGGNFFNPNLSALKIARFCFSIALYSRKSIF
jgi:hypothetical protein